MVDARGLSRILEPIRNALRLIVSKAVVNLVDDSSSMQVLQVIISKDEVIADVERVQPMGLTSVPESGAEAITLLVNGERQHVICIAVDSSANRPTGLAPGEVCIYRNPANKIVFKANGDTEVYAEGDIKLGSGTRRTLMTEDIIAKFNAHTHLSAAPGDPTGTPGLSTPPTIYTAADATLKTKAQ